MWLTDNLAQSLIALGLLMLAIEILILGFATFFLFFVGLAALISGALIYAGIVPDTVSGALLSVGLGTVLFAVVLWQPLKNLQTKVETKRVTSDLIGHSFTLTADISPHLQSVYHYSGINWRLTSDEVLAAGTKVEVVEVEVGQFKVKACQLKVKDDQ
jgi:membrane protein implicated in regulation of membrane protease activity